MTVKFNKNTKITSDDSKEATRILKTGFGFGKQNVRETISEDDFKEFNKLYLREIQSLIARTLTSKYTPKISLIFDESFQESLKVQSLLDKL